MFSEFVPQPTLDDSTSCSLLPHPGLSRLGWLMPSQLNYQEEGLGNSLKVQNCAHQQGIRMSDHAILPLTTFTVFLCSLGKVRNPEQDPQSLNSQVSSRKWIPHSTGQAGLTKDHVWRCGQGEWIPAKMRMGPRDSNWRKILPPLGLNLHRREQLLEPGMQMSDMIHTGVYVSMYVHLIDTAAENSYKCFGL